MFRWKWEAKGETGAAWPRGAALGAAVFLLAQVGLLLAFAVRTPSRDPEYDLKLSGLKSHLAEGTRGRPLVLLMGSSRVALGVQPGLLAANRPTSAGGPVVYNFGLCGSGSVMHLTCLRRLLADGVRPDMLILEFSPLWSAQDGEPASNLFHERLRWDDLAVLAPEFIDARSEYRSWLGRQCLPWKTYHKVLLNQWDPSWLNPEKRFQTCWDSLDSWGWLACPSEQPHGRSDQYAKIDLCRPGYVAGVNGFRGAGK